jgi:hypothetical protein
VVDSGEPEPEPEPEVDAGGEPEPSPEPEVDASEEPEPEQEPEPLPEPVIYWDGSEGNANNWLCRGSSSFQMTPQDEVFVTGGLLHCAINSGGNADGYAYLDARIPHEGFETHKSLTFWACGRGSVRAAVVASDEFFYSPLFELTGYWQQYRIEFDELDPSYNPEGVTGMTFELKEFGRAPYTTDLRVDVLEFTSSDDPLETSDVACP